MDVVASLSEGRTAAAQCGLFTHKSVPVIFEPPCILWSFVCTVNCTNTALRKTGNTVLEVKGDEEMQGLVDRNCYETTRNCVFERLSTFVCTNRAFSNYRRAQVGKEFCLCH